VRFACWNESTRVKAFMVQQGFGCCGTSSFAKLEQYYENKLLKIATEVLPGRTLVVYQEVYDNNITLPPSESAMPAAVTKLCSRRQ
jgi:hypothetical protein